MNYSVLLLAENSNFGTRHIVSIICSIVLIFAFSYFLRKVKLENWYKIALIIGVFSETLKIGSYILANESLYGGYLPKTDLPFQLCSIQLIFFVLLNLVKNEKFHRVLLSFMMPTCLLGGILAILLPTSSAKNMWVITIQYFTYHSMIVAFAIHILTTKEIELNIKDYFCSLKFLLAMGFIAIYLNSMFFDVVGYTFKEGVTAVESAKSLENVEMIGRVNFMYVIDPPASGLPLLNKDHGWLVYIVHYAVIALTFMTLCYIKPIIKAIKNKRNKETTKKTA